MLWCLHGFLGQASDWDQFDFGGESYCLNLFAQQPLPAATLEEWGRAFADQLIGRDEAPLVMGYSLGGRLALHALIERLSAFRGAIIISAHLGLLDKGERQERRDKDNAWARRFLSDQWDSLLFDWEQQSIFGNRHLPFVRKENDFSREALAHSLRQWSLGEQENLGHKLKRVHCPVLWIAGERDLRYGEQAHRAMKSLSAGELWVAPNCGHRVPWEAPQIFEARVKEFLCQHGFLSSHTLTSA